MILDSGVTVEEELIYQNDEAKRIYYRKKDALRTIGYIASSYVDQIDDRKSRLHILSWFDVAPDEEASVAAARFKTINRGTFEGFISHHHFW